MVFASEPLGRGPRIKQHDGSLLRRLPELFPQLTLEPLICEISIYPSRCNLVLLAPRGGAVSQSGLQNALCIRATKENTV